ncbi:MAG: hypothetical protein ABR992_07760 [Solirubrobacteraceae bacterium]
MHVVPKVIVSRLRGVAAVGLTLAIAAGASVLATSAGASNLFTLDPAADSMGPIAVDSSGNGYVAWLHKGTPDTVMFCKLAPNAHSCPAPITLPVTLAEAGASTSTPFPVLGPGGDVFVVAPSYDTDEMIMWQSSDGGASFGSPSVIAAPSGGEMEYVCEVETNLDDVLAFNAYGGQYDPSQGLATLGGSASNLDFEMSSSNPDIDWTFAFYGQGCVYRIPEKPNQSIPEQHFSFGSAGGEESSLGWVSGPAGECALSYPGDEVEAFEDDDSNPASVRFYHYSSPTGPCSVTEKNLSPSSPSNWSGPTVITQGAFTRLAGGAAGLFLLSGDAVSPPATQPTAVDVRHYDLATHSFGAPQQLAVVKDLDYSDGGPAGGIGENFTTGEVAAVWPDVAGETHQLSLYISTDDGTHFSSAEDIARIGSGYADWDNARVALAPDGEGFVTWEDDAGLHVANLEPLPATYARLVVHHHSLIELEVTCESPKATCIAGAVIRVKGTVVAVGHGGVPSGTTTLLPVRLNATGRALLKAAHGHLHAKLHLIVTDPGASTERLTVNTVLVR